MLDLTVPMVEVWFSGAKLGEYANDLEALKAASLHADSLPLIAESIEYELRRDTMKYIVHRRITGPDAPALGPVLTISSTELTVTLDRPASGPTRIDYYLLQRLNNTTGAWNSIADGINIFGSGNAYSDTGLTASTTYYYRLKCVDETERSSEWSYSQGITSAGAVNQPPVWDASVSLTIRAGSTQSLVPYCTDPESDQIAFSRNGGTAPASVTVSVAGLIETTVATAAGSYTLIVRADDGDLTADKTITLTISAADTTRNIFAAATFDEGRINANPGSRSDPNRLKSGLYVGTLPTTQSGLTDYITSTTGTFTRSGTTYNFGPSSPCDLRVVASETVGGVSVTPREGAYFLRSEVFKGATAAQSDPHYDRLNVSSATTHVDANCKPRTQFYMGNQYYGFEWDREMWFGMSVHIPSNWEHEQNHDERISGPVLFSVYPRLDTNATHLTFHAYVPDGTEDASSSLPNPVSYYATNNITCWIVRWTKNSTSHLESGGTTTTVVLAPIQSGTNGDIGKWTDFVFRMCFNPFTTATTVGGFTYRANTGALEIWKSSGPVDGNGDRGIPEGSTYTAAGGGKVYSVTSGGVGCRKHIDSTKLLQFFPQCYYYGLRNGITSSRTHSVWLGFDAIRFGFGEDWNGSFALQNNAASGFTDVLPGNR